LPDVERPDARSRQTSRPAGVTKPLQCRENTVEPAHANRAFNLLAKDRCKSALSDELGENREQVSVIVKSFPLAGG